MGPLARLALSFRRGFGRVTPDPFVLAVVLTVLVFALAAAIEGKSPAARLFADHSFLPPIIDIDPVDAEATVGD